MSALQTCILLVLACAACTLALGPVYELEDSIIIPVENSNREYQRMNKLSTEQGLDPSQYMPFSDVEYYEWEGYDGWFNNPAHPEWGGADMPLERKTPVVYPDGVYEIIPEEARGNVLLISNISQHGLSGLGAQSRTAFFTFFGQQVVEEMLDAQRPGCIPEYENIRVPKCHPIYDPNCNSERIIPFLRNRYDFGTGYAPNNPRMQLNEITPWMDGGLVYGPFKAWTDAIRSFKNGELASQGLNGETSEEAIADIRNIVPIRNNIGLPLANPTPPANASLFPVNRFWTIGNPRGDENPFLLSMGILWFRVHQYWARQLYASRPHELAEEDEWLFNRARQFTIATYQHIVYDEWLPLFIPLKFPMGANSHPYTVTEGYSAYFNRTGYNQAINPQVAHIFQSAAMRWGHTVVTPGIWRRELHPTESSMCLFGSPLSPSLPFNSTNSFLSRVSNDRHTTWRNITSKYYLPYADGRVNPPDEDFQTLFNMLSRSVNISRINSPEYSEDANVTHFGVRTCNSFWNPQVTVRETNVDGFFLGMSSQAAEREDTIITPDLRGNVFGPLDYTRRDLMAVNMQRARDHGLPDYNSARVAYGLSRRSSFEDINPLYGVDMIVTESIENLRDVYNNDIDRCDIWACGLAETIPSDSELAEQGSGPGELFSEVLFDQFMRVRHADRFWYENYEYNGLFTKEEFMSIKNLTIKDLLIAVTHIRSDDINEPFVFETAVCPQPFQLSELWMDDCVEINYFDYYVTSEYEVPIVWGFVFIYAALVVMVMFMMAAYNQHRRTKILSAGRTTRAKKIEGTDVTGGDGEVLVAYELRAGLKDETRLASMKFGPGKRIKLFSGDTVLREVDLRTQADIVIQRPFDDHLIFVVKIPNEYDIIIRCNTPIDRTTFIDKIENFLNDIGLGHTIEEPQKKVMMRVVFTKKQRQSLLENFFKSVFREGAKPGIGLGETNTNILECELTRAEFADAMSLKPDSLFVEQMFQLIDQDGNGFVSFREFLDMIVIFAKGSPEDKIKLMFDMYDVDKSGRLDRIEFKKMLKAMMEMVSAQVTPDQMDQLIESMFAAAGFQNKQDLTLEDFNILLRDHKEELSSAHLNVKGYDVPEVEIEKKDSKAEGGEVVPSRYRSRETAPARARRTIIKAYGRTAKGDPREKSADAALDSNANAAPSFDIPVQNRSFYSQSTIGRYIAVFIRYVENQKLQIFYFTLFMLIVAAIFVERSYYYSVEREHAGLRRIAGYGVTITRGAASAMMFTYSVLLLTMARNFITYLRETIFNNYVPFDSYIDAHKIVALTALFFTIMHAVGHGINFYHISTQTANDLTCIFREVYHRTHVLPKFSYWLFLTMTGFAGFMVTLITVIIFVFATLR